MKKMKLLPIAMMLFAFVAFSFSAMASDGDTKTLTYAQLKAQYGVESIQFIDANMDLQDDDIVQIMENPCGGVQVCAAALALARIDAQRLANDCCCVQLYGALCCEPSTGAMVNVLGIATPNSRDCGR